MKKTLITAVLTACISTAANAEKTHNHHHDHNISSAPIGIMGDHAHAKGQWMASYRYGTMQMKGKRSGTDSISTEQVLESFMVSPKEMTMEMHMFGLMYGLTDAVTLMGVIPYTRISMDHVNRSGMEFSTETEGAGDTKLSAIYNVVQTPDVTVNINAGLGLPTGSIEERDTTPMGYSKLPYAMQLGSGTYDLLPGITAVKYIGDWSLGGQLSAVIRTGGNNDEGYHLGNQYKATAWVVRSITDSIAGSLRLDGTRWGDIKGQDAELNPMMVPTARTDLRGGKRVDVALGMDYKPFKLLSDQRLALEVALPIYQDLDGPQLETDYKVTAGWQLSF